jgi:hypothetical protein
MLSEWAFWTWNMRSHAPTNVSLQCVHFSCTILPRLLLFPSSEALNCSNVQDLKARGKVNALIVHAFHIIADFFSCFVYSTISDLTSLAHE